MKLMQVAISSMSRSRSDDPNDFPAEESWTCITAHRWVEWRGKRCANWAVYAGTRKLSYIPPMKRRVAVGVVWAESGDDGGGLGVCSKSSRLQPGWYVCKIPSIVG